MPRLHIDVAPKTLAILHALLRHRQDHRNLGYSPDESGADVDWKLLTTGPLSATERATIKIAWGCSIMEHHGSTVPLLARPQVRAAIDTLTGTA